MKKTILLLATAILSMGILEGCRKTIADASGSGSGSGGSGGSGTSGTTNLMKTAVSVEYDPYGSAQRVDSIINNITYDSQNRLSQIITTTYNFSPISSYKDTSSYTYNNKTVIENDDGQITTYYLNASGTLADSAYTLTHDQFNTTFIDKYTYDMNGYLTKWYLFSLSTYANGRVSSSDTTTEVCTIVNGNISKNVYSTSYPTTAVTASSVATYNSQNRSSVAGYYLPDGGMIDLNINGILGHPSLNLLATYTYTFNEQSTTSNYSYSYSYTTDSQNRVTAISGKMAQYDGIHKPFSYYCTYY